MTPDEFIEAHRTQTPLAFAATVSQLTETQRKTLSKAAQQLLKEARESERELRRPEVLMRLMANRAANMNVFSDRQLQVARAALAVLAVCPRSAAAKPVNWTDETSRAAVRILLDRRPDWADAWLEAQFQMRWGLFRFEEAIQLIRAGVCRRPTSAGYARIYAAAAVTLDHETQPDLLEDLWLLFQHDVSTWAYAPKPKEINLDQWRANARHQPGESYRGAYFRLVYHLLHQGHIDRQRLLDEILAALWRDFNSSARAGLVKLHDLIEPTASERLERQPAYRELLRHDAPAVVGFGLQMLKLIQKDGQLDAPQFIESVPAVMAHKTKAQPIAALAILKLIGKQQGELVASAVQATSAAISHASTDVQEAVLTLLETWSRQANADWTDLLAGHRVIASPKFRERLDALLQRMRPGAVEGASLEPQGATIDPVAIRQRLATIPSDLQSEFGLVEALGAIEADNIPPPLDVDRLSNVLCDLQPVMPIQDLDELIDTVSRVIETYGSPIDYERIIDAICRLRGHYPDDFEARTQALAKRIQNWYFAIPAFKLLILEWLSKTHGLEMRQGWLNIPLPAAESGQPHYAHLLSSRINVIRSRLKTNEFGPLLSLPTHEHGWIDPRDFVARIRRTLELGVRPNRNDLTFGLLRLAPDFRAQAIAEATSLPEPYGQLIVYALGGGASPSTEDQKWAGPWLSACRVRSPRGRLPELEGFTYPALANGIEPAQFTWRLSVFEEIQGQSWYLHQNLIVISVSPELPKEIAVDQFPTISLLQSISNYRGNFINDRHEEWMATLWPANSDSTVASGMKFLVQHLFYNSSAGRLQGTLSPLLRNERSWSPVAVTALWLAALSSNAEFTGIARDALAAGLQDGRAHPDTLLSALLPITARKWFKLNRLAETLRDVSKISSWAAMATSQMIDSLISAWSTAPRDSHLILELQGSLLSELQMPLSVSAAKVLSQWSGSSKSAKLARELCNLKFEPKSPGRQAALWEALELRVARAERVVAFRSRPSYMDVP